MCNVVLSHDSADFFKVVEDGETGVLHLLLGRAELLECIITVKGGVWTCTTIFAVNRWSVLCKGDSLTMGLASQVKCYGKLIRHGRFS